MRKETFATTSSKTLLSLGCRMLQRYSILFSSLLATSHVAHNIGFEIARINPKP